MNSRFSRENRLIAVYLAVFSLIPMLTRNIIPHDMIENLYWGKELQLGYEKHPPLFAWISYFFYKLFGSWPESLYILTQLNLLLGFYFIYKTSRLMLNKEESYASVLIFMTSVCAVFGNEKFNASTILMSLFPAMFYFFLRILKFEKKTDAVFLGIFSALAFIGKYFALLYIGCMGLFLLQNKECRKFFKMPHFYIAAVVFMICISWHVIWIIDNDCVTLKYALAKTADCPPNRFYAFNFLIMQFIFFATSFWALAYACRKDFIFFPQSDHSPEEKFIIFITIVPNVILFLVSLITGMRIGSFWGTNMMMTLGTYLVILNKKIDTNRLFCFTKKISIFFAAVLFLKLEAAHLPIINDPTYALNIREISKKVDEDWNKKFGDQKMKILKTDKATAALHIHLKDSPSSYDTNRLGLFQVFDLYPSNENAVAVFLSRKNGEEVARFRKLYNGCILFENTVPVTDDYFVYYAFVNTRNIGAEKKL